MANDIYVVLAVSPEVHDAPSLNYDVMLAVRRNAADSSPWLGPARLYAW